RARPDRAGRAARSASRAELGRIARTAQGDPRRTAADPYAARHRGRVEIEHQLAAHVDRDAAAEAAERRDLGERLAARRGEAAPAEADPRVDVARERAADEEVSRSGRRHRARGVVGPGPDSGQTAVGDPARKPPRYPARRCRGREVAVAVARDGAYRA